MRCSKGAGNGVRQRRSAWVLTATLLVMMMLLPGLALFYGGLVRAKNLLSVMSQVMGDRRGGDPRLGRLGL